MNNLMHIHSTLDLWDLDLMNFRFDRLDLQADSPHPDTEYTPVSVKVIR